MICGTGCDIVEVSRFSKWIINPKIIDRYFNQEERLIQIGSNEVNKHRQMEFYAVRFAAKEAFSKALGTGIVNFKLKEVYIKKNKEGKPDLFVSGLAKKILEDRYGSECKIHVSMSHEKEYALAFVIIER